MHRFGSQMRLSRGQSHMAHFRRGAVIGVVSGSIQVTQRVWLEHTAFTNQTLVQRGGVFLVPCSGWLEISADRDAVIGLPLVAGFWSGVMRQIGNAWKTGAWGTVKRVYGPGVPAV